MSATSINFALCLVVMVLAWRRQLQSANAGWVDVLWSLLLGLQALIYLVSQAEINLSLILGLGLAIAWSLRLSLHLGIRVANEAEDGRYAALRQHWGTKATRYFLLFYLAQAFVAWLFGLVFSQLASALATAEPRLPAFLLVGVGIGLIAIACEGIADRQLARHRQTHPGQTCRRGFWRYSRHPNYFFEWLHWWAYPIMLLGYDLTLASSWMVWLAPVLMLMFLYRFTGIPYTEKQAIKSRGDDYRQYMRETSAFFPWFPRSMAN